MKQLTKTVGSSNTCKYHDASFSVRHGSPCVRFLRYSDRKLTKGTVIWKENRPIIRVIRFEGFSFRCKILTEKFYVPKVAF